MSKRPFPFLDRVAAALDASETSIETGRLVPASEIHAMLQEGVTLTPADAFLGEVVSPAGVVGIDVMSAHLRVTKAELARVIGLPSNAASERDGLHADTTQTRLRDVAEIVARVTEWAGSGPQAFAWYRALPIPAFGDRTAEDLVKEGRAEALKAYLSRIASGGYA